MVNARLAQIITEEFEIDPVTEDTGPGFGCSEWDSLGHLNLMFRLESEFKIKFKMKEIVELNTVGLIQEYLKRKGAI